MELISKQFSLLNKWLHQVIHQLKPPQLLQLLSMFQLPLMLLAISLKPNLTEESPLMCFHKELEINVKVDRLQKYNTLALLLQMEKYLTHQFQEASQSHSLSEK